jgi:hypothetical protein
MPQRKTQTRRAYVSPVAVTSVSKTWRGEMVVGIVKRELARLRTVLPDSLQSNLSITVGDEDMLDGGGLYDLGEIKISTKRQEGGGFRVGRGQQVIDGTPRGILLHELGHHINRERGNPADSSFFDALKADMSGSALDISKGADRRAFLTENVSAYAATGGMEEAFCESMAAALHEGYGLKGRLPKSIEALCQSFLGEKRDQMTGGVEKVKAHRRGKAMVKQHTRKRK